VIEGGCSDPSSFNNKKLRGLVINPSDYLFLTKKKEKRSIGLFEEKFSSTTVVVAKILPLPD
jgi:hypothetical protein